jgi:DUF2939 family protein
MRFTIRALAAAAVLWVCYAAWPVLAVYDLAHAVERRDSAGIAERVNFPAVRRSLTEQIVTSYLKLSGRDARLGTFNRHMALAAFASIADPVVAGLVSADALVELLHKGWPASVLPEEASGFRGLGAGSVGNVWWLATRSEPGLRRFGFAVPAGAPAERRFKLQFRLTSWTWKLSAIELPEELRVRLAQELAKHIDRK